MSKRPTLETKADQVVRDTRLGDAYKIDKKKLSTILIYLAKWHTIGLLWADRELLAASLDRAIEALLDKPDHLSRWRLLRQDSGLLLGQAARLLGIGVVELSAIETGKTDPSGELIVRMEKLYSGEVIDAYREAEKQLNEPRHDQKGGAPPNWLKIHP